MITHDVLAFAIAQEAIRRVAAGAAPWNRLFSATSYITASRAWPIPDFVIADSVNGLNIGGEFKPPRQSKREYLTGLGQAIAYTRDFDYSLLILPTVADDGFSISRHVAEVLSQAPFDSLPVGILTYNPSTFSPLVPGFEETRFFHQRLGAPLSPVSLDQSFFAKWREMSPDEMGQLLGFTYDEMRHPSSLSGTVRDRAFSALWDSIQNGNVRHWAGDIRNYQASAEMKVAVSKNYRNFMFHIGWTESNGSLTREGLEALHICSLYGSNSQPFLDAIARSVLLEGKHLILFNAISEYQDSLAIVPASKVWLGRLEVFLEDRGLLKRNPARHAAAVALSSRGFMKAEKQLWKNLGLIIPRGREAFHPGRGFIFNWSRITSLLQGAK